MLGYALDDDLGGLMSVNLEIQDSMQLIKATEFTAHPAILLCSTPKGWVEPIGRHVFVVTQGSPNS
tara:strand:- start:1479 stop:1676 length:198 start_codon:yes stop_codon:yes gene_type:complete